MWVHRIKKHEIFCVLYNVLKVKVVSKANSDVFDCVPENLGLRQRLDQSYLIGTRDSVVG